MNPEWPALIDSEEQLDEVMTRPQRALIDFVQTLTSPLLILGAGGKMGPSLALLARRAADAAGHPLRIVAASRFSEPELQGWLEARGVETVACDLLEREALARLPEAAEILYLVGLKFGTQQNPALTWAVNALVPSLVAERFPQARIAALSTGNVYPMMPVTGNGATETDTLAPTGEYAHAAIARERIFQYGSQKHGTSVVLLRLNYAVDLRYGVLVDIAQKVWQGEPLDVGMGYLNCIWQGDANDLILRSLSLARSPAAALNLTGKDVLSVRMLAERFAELMDRPARIIGSETDTALLSNSARLRGILGDPPTSLDQVMRWTAHWIMRQGRTLDKPTHFGVRDGKY